VEKGFCLLLGSQVFPLITFRESQCCWTLLAAQGLEGGQEEERGGRGGGEAEDGQESQDKKEEQRQQPCPVPEQDLSMPFS
jgi:hypothetical protein